MAALNYILDRTRPDCTSVEMNQYLDHVELKEILIVALIFFPHNTRPVWLSTELNQYPTLQWIGSALNFFLEFGSSVEVNQYLVSR